jgi:DNA invertase Pin-like site-specific DNA recombinase
MATLGYARVSAVDQNDDRQMIAMCEQGIPPDRVFVDKQSGKDFDRPAYKSLLENLKPGDLLYMPDKNQYDRRRHYCCIIRFCCPSHGGSDQLEFLIFNCRFLII